MLFFNVGIAQSNDEAHVKSSYILNFVEETNWKEKRDTFHIAIVGNSSISKILVELSKELSINDRPFKVFTSFKNVNTIEAIYLADDFQGNISLIRKKHPNLLVITNEGIHQTFSSIYFVQNLEGNIQYQLNLKEFENANLKPSAKLLMYGGFKDEAFDMMEESENELRLQMKKLNERDKIIREKEAQILELSEKMKKLETQIFLREKNILRLKSQSEYNESSLLLNQRQLDSLRISYGGEKQLTEKTIQELHKIEQQLYQKHDSLNQYQSELIDKANEIEINNEILKDQNSKIENQTKKLSQLDSQLKQSQKYFWVTFGVVLIILVVLFFLYREYKMKQKNLVIIEEQNQKILEASLHKDEFIANLTHEVRTPLNAITGYTNLLLSKNPKLESKSYLQKVLLSSNNLLAIINDILDLSKIEAGKITFESINFDFISVLNNTFETMKIVAETKKLDYELVLDDKLPEYVNSDPTRLNQVLLNLLSNAIKFTDKGTVKLTVNLLETSEEKSSILFKISDTGKGINKNKLDSVFESFTQEDVSTTRKYGGTGLGLTISQRIIKLLGSEIVVKSEENKGSEFSFVLEMNNADAIGVFYNENNNIVIDGIQDVKIIIADDEKMNRELFLEQFSSWNSDLKIDVAKDGKELVDMVAANDYDLVLTDVRMPKVNGIDATKQILNINPGIVIIGVSANAMDNDVAECLEAGMKDYITKPVNFNDLLISIAKQLKLNYTLENLDDTIQGVEYFQRMKVLCNSEKEFYEMRDNLIEEINAILSEATENMTYFNAHSLLNKIIYVNDIKLIDTARVLEANVKAEKLDEVAASLQELKKYWHELNPKIIL